MFTLYSAQLGYLLLLFMLPLGKVMYVRLFPTSVPVWKAGCFIFNYLLKIFLQKKLLTELKYFLGETFCPFYLLHLFWCIIFKLRKHQT